MRTVPAFLLGLCALPAAAGATDKVKQARAGDVAEDYELTDRGDLFRQIGKHRCQITSRVSEFKIAEHPADEGAIYFVKDGDLKVLLPPTKATPGCPKAEVRTIATGIKKYALVTDPRSPIFLLTLDGDDRFEAIGPGGVIDVAEAQAFTMNACFGQDGRTFSSYAAFIIDRYGLVTKLKGKEAGEKTDFKRAYASLDEFKSVNKVCENE